ncbi:AraC family transcriptional regulator [Lutibacter sp. B1]|uniref:helix-turn-helix domain-containing protein n=1 Tax=Lutibacter sp. B1 TaxID=2725996 RepID=UPI001456876B|nr:helix-turn-helix transcriptional regulator [Lutibacter sp. B1]
MNETTLQYIKCNSLVIATSVETSNSSEHNVYYPDHLLIYVQQGQFNFRNKNQLFTIEKGAFCLIKKYTSLTCFKTWGENEDGFKMIAFMLNDEFIRKVSAKLPLIQNKDHVINKPFLPVSPNSILLGLMSSLEIYLKEKQNMAPDIVELKTLESLIGIARENKNILTFLSDFSQPSKAELRLFMEHYYTQKIPLNELAKLSGRSIATFHREFKRTFNTSPHQWIKERRLLKAKELLTLTNRKPSDIYIELGFEDLAHFSRSFKKHFGKNPSKVTSLVA